VDRQPPPAARQRGRRPRSRRATYGAATRIARIVHGLLDRPRGWGFRAIARELSISERTLLRYLSACARELVDDAGRPLIEVVKRGDERVVRFASPLAAPTSTAYQTLALYFAISVFDFLDGTVLKDGVRDLWEKFLRVVPASERPRLSGFERKFYSVPYAVKDYRGHDEVIDTLLRALVFQRVLVVENDSPWLDDDGDERPHALEPYTLAMYRGGLYLIGRSRKYRKIVWLAVERIRRAEMLAEQFPYPRRYTPAAWVEGTFGIVSGPETEVEIVIPTDEGRALLSARRLHPTQRFTTRPDGTTLLTMRVRGTEELKNWILSLGPHVVVQAPASLRAEVARAARAIAALYR
jgi:predicted DNA-binding transcriptional regulator YafY